MASGRHKLDLERLPTGIPGLDDILRGGFLKGGVYIVQGSPGAGKTIFANQFCFNHVIGGGRAAYVTLLAESHTRMLQHLRPMSFFDEAVIPDSLYYVSGFQVLEEEGLKGFRNLLRSEIQTHKASLLILDGLVAAEETAPSDREFKKFIHEVQSHAAMAECTVLLLTSGGSVTAIRPEHTMVDGLIELEDQFIDVRTERSLRVRKFRGSGFLRGRHPFRITGNGVTVFPRIEAAFAEPSRPQDTNFHKLRTGVEGLDELLGGGLPGATSTMLVGPTGSGKTTLGLQFLSLATPEEPGLLFSFFETPERLRAKSRILGIDLPALEAAGALEIIWQAQGENILDELGHQILSAVRRRGVKRLFVDGLGGFIESTIGPDRIGRYFSVLSNELRALGATALYTLESPEIMGSEFRLPVSGVSAMVENVVFMRFAEEGDRLQRTLSVLKVRDSDFNPMTHDLIISDRGVSVDGSRQKRKDVTSGHADRAGGQEADPADRAWRPSRKG